MRPIDLKFDSTEPTSNSQSSVRAKPFEDFKRNQMAITILSVIKVCLRAGQRKQLHDDGEQPARGRNSAIGYTLNRI